jgi:hypothetical protein
MLSPFLSRAFNHRPSKQLRMIHNISRTCINSHKSLSVAPAMSIQRRGFLDNMQKTLNNKMSGQSAASNPEQLFMEELEKLSKT